MDWALDKEVFSLYQKTCGDLGLTIVRYKKGFELTKMNKN
jgi:hypothetical protein